MARRTVTKETAPPAAPEESEQSLRYEVAALIERVTALEANRPGRKAKPLVALRQDGVCAVSPGIDSTECPDASIFRYQQGCHGNRCKAKQHAAYERRKDAKSVTETPETTPETPVAVKTPAKRVATKTPATVKANGKTNSKTNGTAKPNGTATTKKMPPKRTKRALAAAS
jgi:hypothetical protein